jgi:hypothetical protein
MHPKIKSRPAGATFSVRRVKPLLLHEVVNPAAPAPPASRRGVPRRAGPEIRHGDVEPLASSRV